jgi:DNA polymerase-1
MVLGLPYREAWAIDFEFVAGTGENPQPVCLVAKEIGTGRLVRLCRTNWAPDHRSKSTTTP